MKPIRANILPPLSSTRGNDLKSMSVDELWKLHEEVTVELAQKLQSEKARLKQRLRQVRGTDNVSRPYHPRRNSRS
jgi:DNA-binding protein H-NS